SLYSILFNCSTFGSVSTQTNLNPSHDTGCSEFKGPSWFLCLENCMLIGKN
ncbi:hypothetical protein LEP1GSC170_2384, partial [Leptospira interrogans serovar Bataviae str. HAI135]